MATVALSSTVKTAADGDTYVSSAQAYDTEVSLASDFDANDRVRIEATGAGKIEVKDAYGHRIGFVAAESAALAVLDDAGVWRLFPIAADPVANLADLTAPTLEDAVTGAFAVPAADSLDALYARVNAIVAILKSTGLVKAE